MLYERTISPAQSCFDRIMIRENTILRLRRAPQRTCEGFKELFSLYMAILKNAQDNLKDMGVFVMVL